MRRKSAEIIWGRERGDETEDEKTEKTESKFQKHKKGKSLGGWGKSREVISSQKGK